MTRPPEKQILEVHLREGRPAPAVGERGGPASWERAGAGVDSTAPQPFLYAGTSYDSAPAEHRGQTPVWPGDSVTAEHVQGPMMKAPVWTWEVPVYFWLGGLAAGASFVAVAADLAGDEESAVALRRLALGGAIPCAPLLIADLGRPMRFLHMLRVFKPRSPMSMGAWCLVGFSTTAAGAVGADLIGRRREAKGLGALTAVLGTYLGSYAGALLAATAVPVWARSRVLIGPVFVCTAVGSGASAARLVLQEGPTRAAAGRVAAGAMVAELVLAQVNERRLGSLAEALEGRLFRIAKALTAAGIGLRAARRPGASPLFLAAALLFRFGWVGAGRASARDDEAVARTARTR